MKKLLTILGPNGVGKSTTAKAFVEQYENSAYVDAEWCRYMNPFSFSDETKQVVIKNLHCLLFNYFSCSKINTVVFPYGWHGERKQIYDRVIEMLKEQRIDFEEYIIVLDCSKDEIMRRAIKDGRDEERIKRGLENTFLFYNDFDYPRINTTNITPLDVAKQIRLLIP